jgi:Tetratricopeptide repeat
MRLSCKIFQNIIKIHAMKPIKQRPFLLFAILTGVLFVTLVTVSLVAPKLRDWNHDRYIYAPLDAAKYTCTRDESTTQYTDEIAACEQAITLNFTQSKPDMLLHIKLLSQLTNHHYFTKNYTATKTFGFAVIEAISAIAPINEADHAMLLMLSDAYNDVGRAHYFGSSDDESYKLAEQYFADSLEHLKKIKPLRETDIAARINNASMAYYGLGNYKESYNFAKGAMQIREKFSVPDSGDIAESAHNLATTLEELHRYEEADQYWHQMDSIYKKNPDAQENHYQLGTNIKVATYIRATQSHFDRPKTAQNPAMVTEFLQSAALLLAQKAAKLADSEENRQASAREKRQIDALLAQAQRELNAR